MITGQTARIQSGKSPLRSKGINVVKILASLGVICLHTQPFTKTFPALYCLIAYVSRLAVPFFFVASGYFFQRFLLKNAPHPQQIIKRIIRYYGVFILWSLLYLLKPSVFEVLSEGVFFSFARSFSDGVVFLQHQPIRFLVEGYGGHLWFLSALSVSLLCLWLSDRKWIRGCWFGVVSILYIISVCDGAYVNTSIGLDMPLNTRNGLFIGGLCVACGGWVYRVSFSHRRARWFLLGSVVLYIGEIAILTFMGVDVAEKNIIFSTVFPAVSGMAFLSTCSKSQANAWWGQVASCAFGVYLVHVFFIYPVSVLLESQALLLSDVLKTAIVFFLSYGSVFFWRQIFRMNKS